MRNFDAQNSTFLPLFDDNAKNSLKESLLGVDEYFTKKSYSASWKTTCH